MYVHIYFVAEGKQLIDETVQSFNDVKVLKLRMSGWMIIVMDGWMDLISVIAWMDRRMHVISVVDEWMDE